MSIGLQIERGEGRGGDYERYPRPRNDMLVRIRLMRLSVLILTNFLEFGLSVEIR